MVEFMTTSKRAYAKGFFQDCCQCLHSHGLHRRLSNTSRWFWFSFLWSHCSFPLRLGKVFFCAFQVWGLFSPVLWKSCNQIPLDCKVRFPGDSQSLCQFPRLGGMMWGSEPSQQWENFFDGVSFFGRFQHPPVNGHSTATCDSGALAEDKCTTFYSTILK